MVSKAQIPKAEGKFDNSALLPERRLLCAIVASALRDLVGNTAQSMRERQGAREWLMSNEYYDWSFTWIMQQLGLSDSIHELRYIMDDMTEEVIERLLDMRVVN